MKQLTEKPFDVEDAKSLLGNSTENIKSNISIEMLQSLSYSGEARTWWYKDEILGCGGIVIYEENKCEAWSIINQKLANKFRRELLTGSKRFLNKMAEKHNIKYMIATWQADFDPEIHWLEHLGFTKTDKKRVVNDYGNEAYIYERLF